MQLDQVLTSLQSDTRQDLRDLLDGLAVGLNSKPSAADDRDADTLRPRARPPPSPSTTPIEDSPAALKGAAQVNEALLGTEPDRDVARLLAGAAKTTGALIRNEGQLKDLITNFNTHDGGVRERGDQPERLDPPARADARERQRRARLAQRARSRRRAPSRARSCPACARRRRRSTRRSRGSTRPRS